MRQARIAQGRIKQRLTLAALVVATTGAVVACSEMSTRPPLMPRAAVHDEDASYEVPNTLSAQLSISGTEATRTDAFLIHLRTGTVYDFTISGAGTFTDRDGVHNYGLGGIGSGGDACVRGGTTTIHDSYFNNSSDSLDQVIVSGCSADPSVTYSGQMRFTGWVFFSIEAAERIVAPDGSVGTWSGHSSITMTRTPAEFGLGPYNDYETPVDSVSMQNVGDVLELHTWGIPRGMSAFADTAAWVFTPDDGSPPRRACDQWVNVYSCATTIDRPGVITTKGYANSGPYMASRPIHVSTPHASPALLVQCPTSATRGANISCKVSLSDPTLPYTLTAISPRVFADGRQTRLSLEPPGLLAAGKVYDLSGPAVTPTTLIVEGTVDYRGTTLPLSNKDSPATFQVDPRAKEREAYLMDLPPVNAGQGQTTRYPTIASGGSSLGLYGRQTPDWNAIKIATASTGPNAGLSYVISIPGIPASEINVTRALYTGSSWYMAHPIKPGRLDPLGELMCTRSQVSRVLANVERHEGLTMASNSHYGIDQDLLFKWGFGRIFGGLVSAATGSPAAIKESMVLTMSTEWQKEYTYLQSLQAAFDATDTPKVILTGICSLYPE